ncbi:Uncharacterised protein [Mycobacteroides abscessus subsp. abscessus]|nr:Uncharacterised protein [Mycobacteroides abscessus subsp. abscessus]
MTPETATAAGSTRRRSRTALIVSTAAIGAIDTPTAFGTEVNCTSTYGSDGNSAATAPATPAINADVEVSKRWRANQYASDATPSVTVTANVAGE